MRIFCLSIDISTTQNLFKGIINHHLNASNIPILNYLSSIACKKGNSYNGSFQTLHCKWLTTRQVIVIFTSTQNNTKVFEHFKSFIFQKQCSHLSLVIRCKHLAIMALKIQSLTELPNSKNMILAAVTFAVWIYYWARLPVISSNLLSSKY